MLEGTDDGRFVATPDAVRGPGGTNTGVNVQCAHGTECQCPPPVNGRNAVGVNVPRVSGQEPVRPNQEPLRPNSPHPPPPSRNDGDGEERRRIPTEPPDDKRDTDNRPLPAWRRYPGPAQPQTETGTKKNTKASIKLAALNIRGHGSTDVYNPKNKWYEVWQTMWRQKVGVLVVGEAHMDDQRKMDIESLYARCIRLEFTKDPQSANAKGVAFVLNKNMVKTDNVRTREIVPGRAILLETENVNGKPLSVLGIYAPNDPGENAAFWKTIKTWFESHRNIRRPDIMAGDTNVVESDMDRLPAHPDNEAAVNALDDLKTYLRLVDGWRETYPTTRAYTYHQAATQGGAQSRIDRVYIRRDLYEQTFEWEIQTIGIETDHRMVSVRLTTEDAPTVGRGRWVWPAHIMKDKILTEFIHKKGLILERDLKQASELSQRDPKFNAQTLWMRFKQSIGDKARERAKIIVPIIDRDIAELEVKLDAVLADPELSTEERKLAGVVLLEKLEAIERYRHKTTRLATQIRNRMDGEVIGKYWTMLNKPHKPRELIHRLEKGVARNGQPEYVTNSQKMADIARDYHNRIQKDRPDTPPEVRNEKIETVLGRTATKVTAEQCDVLKTRLTLEDVRQAMKLSSNWKAPGLDGITYEIWKTLDDRCTTAKSLEKPAFDIVSALHTVYNDIEDHGMVPGTGFSKSWMCPIYKKNNKADIANYRPISLLNTDYKIFTKALTVKLALIAPDLIHPNQAGFVPGRQIRDQIWLTKRVIELAEVTEHNGVIVALDQEKAYDKIEHDYLWRALASYGIPQEFINTVKALYSDAYTYVVVNGEMSTQPFKVTRGVRQGDPLSCLLFDLAIEPLAESLRQSELIGIRIRGKTEKLIATLFADDTVVYLDWKDDFGTLLKILDEWCIAAGAKFNISKTEMIPIGKTEHKDRVRANRFVNGISGTLIPDHIKIAAEGEPIRTLGAWVGHKVDQVDTWSRTLEKIDAALDLWELGHPTMEGRRLIIMMVVGGMTQYLATVQGMPPAVEKKLEKRVRNFLWAEKERVTVNKETVYAPAEMGGRDLLDIVSRNEAIAITWLKTYLSFGPDRPLWCFVADEILAKKAVKDDDNVDEMLRMNTYLQSWHPYLSDKIIGKDLAGMIAVGKTYGVKMDAIAVSRKIQENMPIWHHRMSEGDRNLFDTKKPIQKCLKDNHRIRLVRDAVALGRKIGSNRHKARRNCACPACKLTRAITGCTNPHKCYEKAIELVDMLEEKWDPTQPQPEDYEEEAAPTPNDDPNVTEFDPRITTHGTLADVFRIFTEDIENPSTVAPNTEQEENPPPEVTVYTDGSALRNGMQNVAAGAGIFFGDGHPKNRALRVPDILKPSNNVAEMVAIKEAVELADPEAPLRILSDSKTCIDGLTKNLRKWEDRGFLTVANGEVARLTVTTIRQRRAKTTLQYVKAHTGISGNEAADVLAAEGSAKADVDVVNTCIDAAMILPGAKLQAMTQSTAYKIIREIKMAKPAYEDALARRATTRNMEFAQGAATGPDDEPPSKRKIWRSTRHKDISRSIRFFLWMLIHDGYKVGRHWTHISGHEEKEDCSRCEITESMEHILTKCEFPGQEMIWNLASELWRKKTGEDLRPTVGQIMACGATDKGTPGKTRLYRILVSESAHLIWRLRNERVIQEKNPASEREVRNRWLKAINNRLQIDCAMTNKKKYLKKALRASTVTETWKKVLRDEDRLPKDWFRETGVLVGVG